MSLGDQLKSQIANIYAQEVQACKVVFQNHKMKVGSIDERKDAGLGTEVKSLHKVPILEKGLPGR